MWGIRNWKDYDTMKVRKGYYFIFSYLGWILFCSGVSERVWHCDMYSALCPNDVLFVTPGARCELNLTWAARLRLAADSSFIREKSISGINNSPEASPAPECPPLLSAQGQCLMVTASLHPLHRGRGNIAVSSLHTGYWDGHYHRG